MSYPSDLYLTWFNFAADKGTTPEETKVNQMKVGQNISNSLSWKMYTCFQKFILRRKQSGDFLFTRVNEAAHNCAQVDNAGLIVNVHFAFILLIQ